MSHGLRPVLPDRFSDSAPPTYLVREEGGGREQREGHLDGVLDHEFAAGRQPCPIDNQRDQAQQASTSR